jgi:hypothetical protein
VPPPAARAANAALLIALVLGAAALLPAWRAVDPDLGLGAPQGLLAQAPPGITRELRTIARTDDRVWNPQPWGSWLELAVPAARVAFDSRIELVPAALWADHDAVIGVRPDWAAILDRWGVTIVVVSQEQIALRDALGASSGWRRVQQDGDGAIFVRADRERRVAALPDSEERTGRFVLDSASPILYRR